MDRETNFWEDYSKVLNLVLQTQKSGEKDLQVVDGVLSCPLSDQMKLAGASRFCPSCGTDGKR